MKNIACIGAVASIIGFSFGQYSIPQMTHRLLLADEGNGKVHYINLNAPSEKWSATCSNRDMQLVGNDRLMVSDNGGTGYSELSLSSGAITGHVKISGVTGVNSAFRLSGPGVWCAADGSPAKILKIDSTGKLLKTVALSVDASVRICRPTLKGTFLVGGKVSGMMCEFDSGGKKIWECNAGGEPYMGVRLPNGTTLISSGYGAQMVLADKQGAVLRKFPTSDDKKKDSLFWNAAKPNFFGGFQVLRNGNIVVANWEGHGTGNGGSGFQLIEIDSALTKAVSYWKQNASMVSSLHGVIVLDSLDTKLLHSDINGVLQPLTDPVAIAAPEMVGCTPLRPAIAPINTYYDVQGRLFALQPSHRCIIMRNGDAARMRKYVYIR
jgi:hypothetical protein